jgi:hypothetical protein
VRKALFWISHAALSRATNSRIEWGTSSMVWKTRLWMICSFGVRNSRSMALLVSGAATKV